ncbi:MAG TPA: CAP domain-containing protein [Acidothermaceae bacterium]
MVTPRVRRASKWVATLSLVASALVGSAALASPAFASPAGDLGAATNASRTSNGLPALTVNASLTAVAQAWANQLAAANVLSHNPALRNQVSDWSVLGENVGMAGDIPTVQAAFMASPPHRANILDPRYTQMGVGEASSIYPSCGCKVLWVVVDFRRPTTVAAAPAPNATPTPVKPATAKTVTPAKPVTKVAPKASAKVVTGQVTDKVVTQSTTVAGVASGVVAASATALRTQLAASTDPAGASSDPVGRMLNFANVLSTLPG